MPTPRTAILLLGGSLLLAACGGAEARGPTGGPQPSLQQGHVWLLVLQNHSFEDVIGNPDAPYLNGLAGQFALATATYAVATESLPNHLALVAGSTFGCADSDCGGAIEGPTLATQLEAAGLTWAGYFEGLPYAGYVGGSVEGYVQHHDPFVYFGAVATSPTVAEHLRPMGDLDRGLADPPSFSLIEPNDRHNMHDGTVAEADVWVRTTMGAIMRSSAYLRGGTIFIIWDQGSPDDRRGCCLEGVDGGRVPLIVVSPTVRSAFRFATPTTHYSVLATIEDAFGLPRLGLAADPRVATLDSLWP